MLGSIRRGATQMSEWDECECETFFSDERGAVTERCRVRISHGQIMVIADASTPPWRYEGVEDGPDHFRLWSKPTAATVRSIASRTAICWTGGGRRKRTASGKRACGASRSDDPRARSHRRPPTFAGRTIDSLAFAARDGRAVLDSINREALAEFDRWETLHSYKLAEERRAEACP